MSQFTAYIFLCIAVATEIIATSALPATEGFTKLKPSLISITGYVICFYALGMSISQINLGIAYGTWGALGSIITPAIGYVLYKQKTSRKGMLGIILIVIGIVGMNLFG